MAVQGSLRHINHFTHFELVSALLKHFRDVDIEPFGTNASVSIEAHAL